MSSLKNFALPGLALLGLVAYWLWRSSADPTAPPAGAPATAPGKAAPPGKAAGRDPVSGGAAPTDGPKPTSAPADAPAPPRSTLRDRAKTDALRLALRDRRPSRGGGGSRADEPADDAPAEGTLDKAYIQARIKEDLLPIAQECYESALEEQPKLGGKLVMQFSIVGDQSVGGVVDQADVDPTSEISHPDLLECMKESMLSLSFPPPEGGGTVSVTYPFVFASDGPEAPVE